mgnify:CR=1 FL=1
MKITKTENGTFYGVNPEEEIQLGYNNTLGQMDEEDTKGGIFIPRDPSEEEIEKAKIVVRKTCSHILAMAEEKRCDYETDCKLHYRPDGEVVKLSDLKTILKELE